MDFVKRNIKRIAIEALGWLLVALGIAALVLPGPGLLFLFAGLALLATRYEWAERRLEPVRRGALKAAADGVQTWPRILFSTFLAFVLIGLGIIWGIHPATPDWWPFAAKLWLAGGWGTGSALIFSGLIAATMIVYSYFNFRDVTSKKSKHKQL